MLVERGATALEGVLQLRRLGRGGSGGATRLVAMALPRAAQGVRRSELGGRPRARLRGAQSRFGEASSLPGALGQSQGSWL